MPKRHPKNIYSRSEKLQRYEPEWTRTACETRMMALIEKNPRLLHRISMLARLADVREDIVGDFVASINMRNSRRAEASLENRIYDAARDKRNQFRYAGPQEKKQHYWLSLRGIMRDVHIPANNSNESIVCSVLERTREKLLDEIANAVFDAAYSDAIFSTQDYVPFIASAAGAANTLPDTARYFLEKRFKMPRPAVLKQKFERFKRHGFTLRIFVDTIRALNEYRFGTNGNLRVMGLAKYLDEKHISSPLEAAQKMAAVYAKIYSRQSARY